MAHSRIWEIENSHCFYEAGQLNNMILSWEPNILQQKVQDFDHVLGIYTQNYFKKTRFGRVPFMMTPGETSISLMELKNDYESDAIALMYKHKLIIQYDFKVKLWKGDIKDQKLAAISKMLNIDNALINAKLSSFQNIPQVTWKWPLAYTLPTEKVESILMKHNVVIPNEDYKLKNAKNNS